VTIDPGSEPSSWLGVGYSSGQATGAGACAEFFCDSFPDQNTGQPWMMVRHSNTPHPNQLFMGPSVAGGANWSTPVGGVGGPVDLRLVLDTTTPLWSVDFQAKATADATYTSVGSGTYGTNPTIRSVALGGNFNVGGSADNFSLTVTPGIPEPASLFLAATGAIIMAGFSRRRHG
jgi:hypothetical protein